MTQERMRKLIARANNPANLIPLKGKDNIVHAYQRDVSELIVYIRELETQLGIESVNALKEPHNS